MTTARLLSVSILALLALVAPTFAQLTVTTDAATYAVGDNVTITIHNAGPSNATFQSLPEYGIFLLETMDCLCGCEGLPVIWDMPPGETNVYPWDTGVGPDEPGLYLVMLFGVSPDPGSIFSTTYLLEAVVADEVLTWSGVKGLFR